MSRIAVTGSAGFVGRHLCEAASTAGHEVLALSRKALGEPGWHDGLRGVDTLVHLAARLPRGERGQPDPEAAFRADNIDLSARVAAACVRGGVRRLVFVSSAGVLGRFSSMAGFDDSSLPAPHDAYTRSKLAAENMLMEQFSDRLEIVIIRPPLIYGPDATGRFQGLLWLALSGWPLPLGAIDAPRSMISVRNLSDLLLTAIRADAAPGLRLLAADAEPMGVAALVRAIASSAGRHARLFSLPPALLGAGLRFLGRGDEYQSLVQPFVVRGSLARDRLDWVPPFSLSAEIRWIVESRARRSAAS